MSIPIIGAKPQLPPTYVTGGFLDGRVWFQFGPVGFMDIEEAEQLIEGLQQAIAAAKAQRAAMATAIQASGNGG